MECSKFSIDRADPQNGFSKCLPFKASPRHHLTLPNLQFFMGETQESFAFVDVAGAGGDKKLSKVQILVGLAPSKKNIFS